MIIGLGAARHALAAMAACAALSLLAPAARADCPANVLDLNGICVACPWPTVPNADRTACTCPSPTSDPNAIGATINGCLFCGAGTVPNSAGTACVPIPVPQCSPGKHVSTSGCPAGQFYCCQACPSGQGWYQAGPPGSGECDVCKAGTVPNPIQDDPSQPPCVACGAGTIASGQTCLACTGNKVANSAQTQCSACTKGSVPNAAHSRCICSGNTIMNFLQGGCTVCQAGLVANAARTKCVPCPAGTIAQFGSCVKMQAVPNPVGLPDAPKKPSPARPVTGPGLLDSTPGLGTQGPGAVGTPLGGPRGGGR